MGASTEDTLRSYCRNFQLANLLERIEVEKFSINIVWHIDAGSS